MQCSECPHLWTCAMVCFEVDCRNKTSNKEKENTTMSNNTNTNNTPATTTNTTFEKAKELAVKVKDVTMMHVNGAKNWAKAHPKHAAGFGVVIGALLLWKLKGDKSNGKGKGNK